MPGAYTATAFTLGPLFYAATYAMATVSKAVCNIVVWCLLVLFFVPSTFERPHDPYWAKPQCKTVVLFKGL